MTLSARQVTTIVATIGIAAVMAPVAVMAAPSPSLVTIASGSNTAKVNSEGSLQADLPDNANRALGRVSVANLPSTQEVSGAVSITNSTGNPVAVQVVSPPTSGTPFSKWVQTGSTVGSTGGEVLLTALTSGRLEIHQVIYSTLADQGAAEVGFVDVETPGACDAITSPPKVTPALRFHVTTGTTHYTPFVPLMIKAPASGARCILVISSRPSESFTVSGALHSS